MSDLAPLVIAGIRDRVVEDLYAENQALRQDLLGTRKIQVTTKFKRYVLAEGRIDNGQPYHGNTNLWAMPLTVRRALHDEELIQYVRDTGNFQLDRLIRELREQNPRQER